MRLSGTIVNYYVHCRRQCWLFAHRINFEDDSEDVRIGRVLHELNSDKPGAEQAIDGIRVDRITKDEVIEVKKSDADPEAARYQLFYYLLCLKEKGIERVGKLSFIERNKKTTKTIQVILDEATEKEIRELCNEIERFLLTDKPDPPIYESKCKRCAYHSYCYL